MVLQMAHLTSRQHDAVRHPLLLQPVFTPVRPVPIHPPRRLLKALRAAAAIARELPPPRRELALGLTLLDD